MKLKPQHAGLILRIGLGIFMLFWGMAKFITPDVWLKSFEALYGGGASTMLIFIGTTQLLIAFMLFFGWQTRIAAGIGVLIYLVMFIPGLNRIFNPFGMTARIPNLLFYEKILVITAFLALYSTGPGMYSIDTK